MPSSAQRQNTQSTIKILFKNGFYYHYYYYYYYFFISNIIIRLRCVCERGGGHSFKVETKMISHEFN